MNTTPLLFIIGSLPFSFIILILFNKIKDKKYKNIKVICLGASQNLIKNYFELKTLIIDNLKIEKNSESNKIVTFDKSKNEEIDFDFKNNEELKMIFVTSLFSNHKKTKRLEEAVINFFKELKINKEIIEKEYREIDKVLSEENDKITTTIVKKLSSNEIFALSKGNPYKIIEKANRIIKNGKKTEITASIRHKLKKQISKLNKKGKKVIAYAYRPLPLKILDNYSKDFTEKELVIIAFAGIRKPLNRKNEKHIKEAKELGLNTLLITQIKEKTASTVASELGLINQQHYEAISGEYFNTLTETKKDKILSKLEKDYIFCETNLKTRLEIIKKLNSLGQKSIWISKKNNLNQTLERYKKTETIKENKFKTLNVLFLYKIPIVFVLLLLIYLKIEIYWPVILFLAIDLSVSLPFAFIFQDIKFYNTASKSKGIIKITINYILQLIISGIIVLNFLKVFGFEKGSKISTSDLLYIKLIGFFVIWFFISQIINIFFTYSFSKNNEKKLKIGKSLLILLMIGIILTNLIKASPTHYLLITEIAIILSSLGIIISFNTITKNANI